ncbi:hypothetical protein BDP55DRAFT_74663 [Colletotrichum godetiae]|uniref:Uncharacterized protein n=1 Tax=Colletotrichum godetiae TaxID=1209918 RepID=A0AAJ0API5_9PEZI|nr:uncharacterized protein BDP55DRAFT_74663 [Colletotrichum godetiae]KAK1688008.1 hypothetical protein BDP55DRAFT_74663 [Colletotrichum godetiae]
MNDGISQGQSRSPRPTITLPSTLSRPQSVASKAEEIAQRSRASSLRPVMTPARPSGGSYGSSTPSHGSISKPVGVRAMAAMFENSSQESPYLSFPTTPRPSRTSVTDLGLFQSKQEIPSLETPGTKASAVSLGRGDPVSNSRLSDHDDQSISHNLRYVTDSTGSLTAPKATNTHGDAVHLHRPSLAQLQRTPYTSGRRKYPSKAYVLDDDKNIPSLGTMTSPAHQPPIAQHVTFPRPSSTLSVRQLNEDGVPVRAGSPGNNSMLHAQIRSLQRQLDVKNEENASLRRQLETRDNLDIGILSEQLRVSKRECAIWKSRAEAAEKRVSVLEHFTRKLKGIKGGDAQNDTDASSQSGRDSIETVATEDGEAVAERIMKAMKGMAGTRSSDGGAAAWWNDDRRGSNIRHSEGLDGHQRPNLTEEALLQVWEAAQELLLKDDH